MAPDGWNEVTSLTSVRWSAGAAFHAYTKEISTENIPFFKVSDMNSPGNERELRVAANTVDGALLKALKARLHPPDTVVFPKVGAALLTNKRRKLITPSSFDNNVMGLVGTGCNPDFLFLLMQTIDFAWYVQSGAVPSINATIVGKIEALSASRRTTQDCSNRCHRWTMRSRKQERSSTKWTSSNAA